MKEFSERCSGAARSIQEYMAVESPPPDEDTMLTLIETNEHLSVAVSWPTAAIGPGLGKGEMAAVVIFSAGFTIIDAEECNALSLLQVSSVAFWS